MIVRRHSAQVSEAAAAARLIPSADRHRPKAATEQPEWTDRNSVPLLRDPREELEDDMDLGELAGTEEFTAALDRVRKRAEGGEGA